MNDERVEAAAAKWKAVAMYDGPHHDPKYWAVVDKDGRKLFDTLNADSRWTIDEQEAMAKQCVAALSAADAVEQEDMTFAELLAGVNAKDATIAALRAEVERAKTIIENYELDYDRVVVRGEKCAMELAVEEASTLRAEVERLKGELLTAQMSATEHQAKYVTMHGRHQELWRENLQLREEVKGLKAILEASSINPNQVVAPVCDHADLGNKDKCPKCGAYFP